MAGSSPQLKAKISQRMLEINERGDVEVKDQNELIRILAFNEAEHPITKVKRAIGSMIYHTGHITRYHDKEGRRHFLLKRPYNSLKQ